MAYFKRADEEIVMNTRFCGIGGQGVVLAAYILGKAAINQGVNAVQTKSYGSAYRGTLCKSDVIISRQRICELEFTKTDILICLSNEGFSMYKDGLKPDGHLFYDPTLVDLSQSSTHMHALNVFELSKKRFDKTIFGNIIMLGYLIGTCPIVTRNAMEQSITETVPEKTIEKNIAAFSFGLQQAIKENNL
ncbi:MAG: 2-oxoacid:acceptor oxidoreductase family protein [Thermoplasmatota archaeon]